MSLTTVSQRVNITEHFAAKDLDKPLVGWTSQKKLNGE